jgi:hypothetical protein
MAHERTGLAHEGDSNWAYDEKNEKNSPRDIGDISWAVGKFFFPSLLLTTVTSGLNLTTMAQRVPDAHHQCATEHYHDHNHNGGHGPPRRRPRWYSVDVEDDGDRGWSKRNNESGGQRGDREDGGRSRQRGKQKKGPRDANDLGKFCFSPHLFSRY